MKDDDDIQKPLFELLTFVIGNEITALDNALDSGCTDQSTLSIEDQLIQVEEETGVSGFVNS